jgi:hypothetical protein
METQESITNIPEDIIWSYMTPHPLDHDSHCEDCFLSWIPGFLNEPDEEQGIPAYLRDENIELYRRIESDAEQWLRLAMTRLWPLLRLHRFKSVQLLIDIFGYMLENGSIAGYNHESSKPEQGVYHLILSSRLLEKRLAYQSEGKELEFKDHYSMEHELIHLLDHWKIVKESVYKSSDEPKENLKYAILKFRSEGIAELSLLLQGHYDSVGSIEEARKLFRKHIPECRERLFTEKRTDVKTREEVFSSYLHYSAGPWLILDMLRSYQGEWHQVKIDKCLDLISRKEAVDHDSILDVLKIALTIDIHNFLEYAETQLLSDTGVFYD